MTRAALLLLALAACGPADTLFLKNGTKVTGRWWSADASNVHFLVDNQLQHYRREDVTAVTFGNNTPVPPLGPSYTPPAPAPESRNVNLPPAPTRRPAEPEQAGVVYFRGASGELTPLERNQAAERRRGSAQYWEMPSARSPVRLKTAPQMQFVLRVPEGIDPESYSLYPMAAANGARRTESQPGRKGGPVTLPVDIAKVSGSTYTLTVKDLAAGEYSFSPSGSNEAYCFGVDADSPGH